MNFMQKQIFYTLSIIALVLLWIEFSYAQLALPPGMEKIENASISINAWDGEIWINSARWVFFKLLSLARIVVGWFALIYIVLMGVNMIVHSENESEISKQKMQILYTLIGFIFLNVPTIVYDVFMSGERKSISDTEWNKTNIDDWFINTSNFTPFLTNIVEMLKVVVLIIAVLMITWWIFKLIIDRGKGEWRKDAQNVILYGGAGLLFLWVVEIWSKTFSASNITNAIGWANWLASKFFWAAFYLAAPVAIFFLIVGAYYYITSMGDESRTKKWKAIIFNTLIATVILLLSYSFISEIWSFFKGF